MRRRILIHLALSGCVAATVLADGTRPGAAVAPFVDEQTFFVARVDVQRVDRTRQTITHLDQRGQQEMGVETTAVSDAVATRDRQRS